MTTENKTINRSFTGVVVSTKMDKTVTVLIERTVKHKKYLKQYTVSKKFKAHDEKNEYKVGDKVLMEECRPISKDKRWRIIKKLG
ncbi:30S ribosomal protein S17 [Candidatus Woesearchaeota archaeon]|jgi:small subunit ribosomal protein S17|nr:30S ribosomal protein S17 [Candidatus Woesearchaeota archaeon]